ncbi:hypothetical protein [Alicyclobacillus vulcanalis]|uniref:Tetratricopeptide repeat-containing protein n=1 Tax=Alicyclobacillus vulcanalis TaxID=252246 RepID=A0A1N7N427_9BACL|nr:hypothetical protein [Alicyclobacillus vulcanalis]SIS93102.1 hypothetical protein SAMN05421799_10755 [Alicyclobacillus vulcanalis]
MNFEDTAKKARGELVIEHAAPGFHQGMELYAMGEFGEALEIFLNEARSLEGKVPQRAGVAYRQAAMCARQLGRMDEYDHYMRLAGREFLRASELPDQPAQHIREYSLLAAQCFLAVENLDLSSKSVSRAKTVDVALKEPVSGMIESAASPAKEGARVAYMPLSSRSAEARASEQDGRGAEEDRPERETRDAEPSAGSGETASDAASDALYPDLGAVLRQIQERLAGRMGEGPGQEEAVQPSRPAERGPESADMRAGHGREKAAWVPDILEELAEMHNMVADLQKRLVALERKMYRALREDEMEGRK